MQLLHRHPATCNESSAVDTDCRFNDPAIGPQPLRISFLANLSPSSSIQRAISTVLPAAIVAYGLNWLQSGEAGARGRSSIGENELYHKDLLTSTVVPGKLGRGAGRPQEIY